MKTQTSASFGAKYESYFARLEEKQAECIGIMANNLDVNEYLRQGAD